MKSTSDVLANHLTTFANRDLAGIMSDYAPNAILFTQHGARRGPAAIRPLLETLIAEFAKPGAKFSMKHQAVEEDCAYIWWTAETADNIYEIATDTFIVRDGKIVAQSFTAAITPRRAA